MMEVNEGANILLFIIIVNSSLIHEIQGQEKFFTDFMKCFNIWDPLFISTDHQDQEFGNSSKNSALIRYNTYDDEERVADYIQKLYLLGDLTNAVFIDNGHQKLLDLLINDMQLFNKGLTGLISELDVASGLNLTLRLDTRLYMYTSSVNTISLTEVYAVNGKKKVQTVGTWRGNTGLIVPMKSMWERRRNLEGILIRVATISLPGLHEIHYSKSGESVIGGSGMFLEPLNILEKELNFTWKLIPSNDGQWGAMDNNGTWTGLISMLISEQIDIAAASLSVTEARSRVVTFSGTIADAEWTLFSGSSSKPNANPWIYFEIFPATVMFICCGMVISISICFAVINYSGINYMHDKFDSEKFTIMNALGLSLMFFRQIYYNVNIKCKSTKLLFILSGISTYLLYIHFTAYLTASSTYGNTDQIKSFKDVLSGGYKVSTWENSGPHDFLKHSKPDTAMYEVYHETMKNSPDAFLPSSPNEVQTILSQKKTLVYWTDLYMKTQYKDLAISSLQGLL